MCTNTKAIEKFKVKVDVQKVDLLECRKKTTIDVLVSFSTIVAIWSSSALTTRSINVGVCFCVLDFFKLGLLSNMWLPLVLLHLKGYRTHSKRSSRWPLHILITLEE